MSNAGFILVWRKARDKMLKSSRPLCEFAAWIDLLMSANFGEGKVENVELQRGELWVSERELAIRWGWNAARVHRFLKSLQEDGSITIVKQKRSKICITNYERYQPVKFRLVAENEADLKQNESPVLISTNQSKKNTKKSTPARINPAEDEPLTVEFPTELDNPECRKAWSDWLAHKRRINKPYKTLESQGVKLRQASRYGQAAFIAAIEDSIGNEYEGFFPAKFAGSPSPSAPRSQFKTRQQVRDEEWEETRRRAAAKRKALNEKLGRA